jgi:hypothetical protein
MQSPTRRRRVEYVGMPMSGGTYETFAGMKQRVEGAGPEVMREGRRT